MALAAVAGVVQLATIKAQKFARGGVYVSNKKGAYVQGPGSGSSDSINAKLSNGEAVINAVSTKKYLSLLSAINSENGNGVAFLRHPKANSNTVSQHILPKYKLGGIMSFPAQSSSQPPVDVEKLADLIGIQVQIALAQQPKTQPVLVLPHLQSVEKDVSRLENRTDVKITR